MKKQNTYLSKQKLEEFKKILLEEKAKILENLSEEEDLYINQSEGDEGDLADVSLNNDMLNRLSDFEIEKLRLIDRALEKNRRRNLWNLRRNRSTNTRSKIKSCTLDSLYSRICRKVE
jgi:hypothetical protein